MTSFAFMAAQEAGDSLEVKNDQMTFNWSAGEEFQVLAVKGLRAGSHTISLFVRPHPE
jgi:hypothetical protein